MAWSKSHAVAVILPVVAAFLIRLAAGAWWEARVSDRFGFGDSDSYWRLAETIRDGRPYEYGSPDARVFRTPGYPLVLAGWLSLWPNGEPPVYWARVLSAVCGAAASLAVYWLGRAIHSRFAGLVAAWLTAIHPEAIGLGVFVLSEAPFHPLLVLVVLYLVRAHQSAPLGLRSAAGFGALAGLSAGAGVLMRPSLLLFLPFTAVVVGAASLFSASSRTDRRRSLATAAAIYFASFVGLALVMAPWWIRNEIVVGKFVPTSLQVGVSLYDGLSPTATGASDLSFVPTMTKKFRDEWTRDGRPGVFEVELDRWFRDESLAWANAHPARVAELAWIKCLRIWNVLPNEPGLSRGPLKIVVAIGLVSLLGLAVVGAWKLRGVGIAPRLLWLPAVYFTLLHMVFVGSLRYRQPALVVLTALAGAGVAELTGRRREDCTKSDATTDAAAAGASSA
ncbi:MAG TPA: glycosyltransferase family 39 protein [Pirellulales bacterium]